MSIKYTISQQQMEKATKVTKLHNLYIQIYFSIKEKSIYIAMFLQKTL